MASPIEPIQHSLRTGSHTLCLYQWPRPDASFRLLAMHGFAGDGLDFLPLFEQLPDVECASVDLLGHGQSEAPPDRRAYFTGAQVAQLSDVFAHLERRRDRRPLFVLGYSMGGRLLLQWMRARQDEAARIFDGSMLIGASPGIDEEEERRRRALWDEGWACRAEQMGVASFMRAWRALPIIRTQERMDDESARALLRRREAQRATGLAGSMRGFGAGVMPSCWSWIERGAHDAMPPLLYLAGEEDEKYNRIGERLVRQMPHARLVQIDGAGHAPHLEAPARCARALLTFMQEKTRGGAG